MRFSPLASPTKAVFSHSFAVTGFDLVVSAAFVIVDVVEAEEVLEGWFICEKGAGVLIGVDVGVDVGV